MRGLNQHRTTEVELDRRQSLTITDNRTGRMADVPIVEGAIPAMSLRQFKAGADDFGILSYDPGFMNTASCRSAITYIDGDCGILEHRGVRIETLAERYSFEEVALLLMNGYLPASEEVTEMQAYVAMLPQGLRSLVRAFPKGAEPMVVLQTLLAALPAWLEEAEDGNAPDGRQRAARILSAYAPILVAWAGRASSIMDAPLPDPTRSLAANLLRVRFGDEADQPALVRAMDALLILHADHEQNCSTSAMRVIGSSQASIYASASGATGALSGPLHGGANEAVLRMLDVIAEGDQTPAEFVERAKRGEERLMGFGHRIYKSYDPRARVIRNLAHEVFQATGQNDKIDIAIELERIALSDPYFTDRKLFPNVDFYSGVIYEAMGFHREELTCLFAAARMAGWVAQWLELRDDAEQKIARPRQLYVGRRSE